MTMIPLWRDTPPNCPVQSPCPVSPMVFPSGRQALTAVLAAAGLRRPDRVAVPEWSSHCVISAVGRTATPLPQREAVTCGAAMAGFLAYEQWGWPFKEGALERLGHLSKVLCLDLVDSSHALLPDFAAPRPAACTSVILSLSKVLGLPGGGMAYLDGEALTFSPDPAGEVLSSWVWPRVAKGTERELFLHMHKSEIRCLHPELTSWLTTNDLVAAAAAEWASRRANLERVMSGPWAENWREWMHQALARGAAPGLAPLWVGQEVADLGRLRCLAADMGVETEVYHFNLSGDPLLPEYAPCLAFPVHGLATGATAVLPELASGLRTLR